MSLGRRVKQLSFRYRAVKCSNCHNCGLMLRTLPARMDEWGGGESEKERKKIDQQVMMAKQHESTAPVISTPCQDAFFPAATSSADIKVCCLLLFVSYLSLRDILLKTLSAMEKMFNFSHNNMS
jgi:hypothetical protein